MSLSPRPEGCVCLCYYTCNSVVCILASKYYSMNSGMGDSMTTGDDTASQSSQRSGQSLLERIHLQRQREAAAAAATPTTPQQIQVPNYGPMPGMGNDSVPPSSEGNYLSNAWSNFSQSMEAGMAAESHHQQLSDDGIEDALLPPTAMLATDENYSMANYFLTFVKDVYGLFLRMHVVVRVIVVAGLLYVAIKLL